MSKKSEKSQWSQFNLGRALFRTAGIEEYDKAMARFLHRLIKPFKAIVEYGFGDGVWIEYLASQHPTKKFIGVEWNDELFKYASDVRRPGLNNLDLVKADMSKPEGVISCDFFFCFGGIEHFEAHTEVLKAWTDKLSLDGQCILTIPNLLNREWLRNRCGIDPEKVKGEDRIVTDSYGYEEIWSPNYAAKVAVDAGLEILELGIFEALPSERPIYVVGLKRRDKNV